LFSTLKKDEHCALLTLFSLPGAIDLPSRTRNAPPGDLLSAPADPLTAFGCEQVDFCAVPWHPHSQSRFNNKTEGPRISLLEIIRSYRLATQEIKYRQKEKPRKIEGFVCGDF
jgi:hypothetical protein